MSYMGKQKLIRDRTKRNARRNKKDPIRILKRMIKTMRYYAEEIPFHKKFINHMAMHCISPCSEKTIRFRRHDER